MWVYSSFHHQLHTFVSRCHRAKRLLPTRADCALVVRYRARASHVCRSTGIFTSICPGCLPLAGIFFELTSIAPIVVCLALYMLPSGIALYQGLHFDCGCYLPGSLESQVYSELEPQFIILLLITAVTGGLHYFNSHRPIRTNTHLA